MPVQTCRLNGRDGYKWGKQGRCYTYKQGSKRSEADALAKATLQGRAIEANKEQK